MDRSKFILLQEHLQKKVGKRVARSIVERLDQKGMNATEELSNSLEVEPTDEGVTVTGKKYGKFLDEGVENAKPHYDDIYKWVLAKGIQPDGRNKKIKSQEQLARAIKASIWNKGLSIRTRHWLSALVKGHFEEWTEDVPDIALEDVLNNIDEILIDAGFIQQSNKTIFKRRNE